MTEFSYSQALDNYKENYDEFTKENEALYFEQEEHLVLLLKK